MERLIRWMKKKIDKIYYSKYHSGNREALIRETFPGIHEVWEYKQLDSYLVTLGEDSKRQLINALMSFYWGEISILNANKNYQKASEYEWIVTFCSMVQAYVAELSILNENK